MPFRNQKVLVVEDNDQDQKILLRYLNKEGFENIRVAASGEEALRLALEDVPDLVLVDTMLPDADGFEVCRRIKLEQKMKAKVIMMTGRVAAVDTEKARAMGADEYCVKTADGQSLLRALCNVIAQPAAAVFLTGTAGPSRPGLQPSGPIASDPGWGPEKAQEAIRLLSRELEEKNEKLKELDQLKSKFISNVSHELRTPLTIISVAISQVTSGIYGLVTEEQRKKLLMALNSAERLKLMIEDLLDFARMEAKQLKLNTVRLNVVDLARDVHASFYALAVEKGLDLDTEYPRPQIFVLADRNRLIQVFTNLLGNALKFTEKGGIRISLVEKPGLVECRVADTGCGMTPEDLPKVFERFQQVGGHAGTSKGTGLGLSICKEIVELHGGRIWAESVPGKGTVFVFMLPLADPATG